MDYINKYLKYKNKYLKIKNKLNGGMDMGDFNKDDKSDKKKSNKSLNIWAKTFVSQDSKKPAENDKLNEEKKPHKPNIDTLSFMPSWKRQLLTYWENEVNKEDFGEFSNFVSYWKDQLKKVIKFKIGSKVTLKKTNEHGVIISETEDNGDGVIYYVVKLKNGKEVPIQNIDLEFEDLEMNLSLLPVDDLDFEYYLDKTKPTNKLVIVTHNLGGQTKYVNSNNKSYLTFERGQMVKNNKGYLLIEEINANLPVPVLDPEADIHLYQEWQQQCSVGEREFDLAVNMKKKYFNGPDCKNKLGKLERTLECPPVYLIDTEENEDIRTLTILNIHNMIASDSSSITQLNRLINILNYIQMKHNTNNNLIIGGDFNFDFFNIDVELNKLKESLKYSIKQNVRENVEELMNILEPLYRYIHENFIFFPHTGEQTNVWSLEEDKIAQQKCVDYIMLSRELEDCVDFSETVCIIDQSKIDASLFNEEAIFFENDFDHAKVKLKIVWKD